MKQRRIAERPGKMFRCVLLGVEDYGGVHGELLYLQVEISPAILFV
jgi:hypothetical protein